jgi:transposase
VAQISEQCFTLTNIGAWIMRHDLTDFEWSVIERCCPWTGAVPSRRTIGQIINGMFYVLRAGSPWRASRE